MACLELCGESQVAPVCAACGAIFERLGSRWAGVALTSQARFRAVSTLKFNTAPPKVLEAQDRSVLVYERIAQRCFGGFHLACVYGRLPCTASEQQPAIPAPAK